MLLSLGVATSCSDFEEVNENPLSTSASKVKPYYSLSASIIGAQQNPDVAERLFVINWAAAARQDGEDGYTVATGYSSDDYNSAAFSKMSDWLTKCYTAIDLAENSEGAKTEHEEKFYANILQMARIWRAYLMSEFTDSFGPAPLNGFDGENPTFSSVKDTYYWMLSELADAVSKIDTSVEANSTEAKCDPAYGFNATKWKNFGISLRMRLAMRLSEADASKAKSEFEAAVKQGDGITTTDGTFCVQEYSGWDDWTGVMSRSWDWQELSATMANLTTNLGGAESVETLKLISDTPEETFATRVKDASTYAGIKLTENWAEYTDNPTKQLFFDGLPSRVDPRALVYFFLPGDYTTRKDAATYVSSFASTNQKQKCYKTEGSTVKDSIEVDATYAWNGLPAGIWFDDIAGDGNNLLIKGSNYAATYPALSDTYRTSKNKRIFFGPWETYFLLAEAAERGWSVGTTAETAYYAGIKASFDYNGLGSMYDAYIDSENYNRVGTSVKWSHTTEPTNTQMTYINGYTKQEATMTYEYPNANNILYAGKKLNDHLTKIITQLYISNTPYMPLENWANHRRLGLPFFEIPTSSSSLTYMSDWTTSSYKQAQKTTLFNQRMKYPTSLETADATGYKQAVSLLGGGDNVLTPLWWAIGGH